jgi:FtsH-binding integral membrane protein
VATDDRRAIIVGLLGWVLGLVALLAVSTIAPPEQRMTWIVTAITGIVLGVILLAYTHVVRRQVTR